MSSQGSPEAGGMQPKPAFEERYRALLGERYGEFLKHSASFRRKSVRANTLKIPVPALRERLASAGLELEPVPWCAEGFWIERYGTPVGNLLEHQLGYLYVQEAASMLPVEALQPGPDEAVLDLCAAPGSKTTHAAAKMGNSGAIVANDVSGQRVKALGMNLQRCGVMNAAITVMRGSRFGIPVFDRVLVDAPCSGTGTIRKSPWTLKIWNPLMIKRLAGQQRQLIEAGFRSLRQGGVLVYSTCSLEPEENEAVVDCLLGRYEDAALERADVPVRSSPAILKFAGNEFSEEISKCLRVWPQDNDTDGFFVARIRKE